MFGNADTAGAEQVRELAPASRSLLTRRHQLPLGQRRSLELAHYEFHRLLTVNPPRLR